MKVTESVLVSPPTRLPPKVIFPTISASPVNLKLDAVISETVNFESAEVSCKLLAVTLPPKLPFPIISKLEPVIFPDALTSATPDRLTFVS